MAEPEQSAHSSPPTDWKTGRDLQQLAGSQCRTADGMPHTAEPAVSSAPDHRGRRQEPPCPHCISSCRLGRGDAVCCAPAGLTQSISHQALHRPSPTLPARPTCWPAHLPTPSNMEPQHLLSGNEPTWDHGRPTSLPVVFPPSGLRSSQGQSPHFTTLRPAQHSPESAAGLLVSQSGTSTSVGAPRNATP